MFTLNFNKMSRIQNFMVDVETIGTSPNCIVLSAAFCTFDMDGDSFKSLFECSFNLSDQIAKNRLIEPDTLVWWLREDSELLRTLLRNSLQYQESLKDTLLNINAFFERNIDNKSWYVWSKGAKFDLPILESLYNDFNVDFPWKNKRNERCARTYMSLDSNECIQNTHKHNPFEDCLVQIKSVQNIYKKYFINGKS